MAKLALLKYSFLFNPDELWSHRKEFDELLAKFFDGIGMEGQVIETLGDPTAGLIFIHKKAGVEAQITNNNKPKDDNRGRLFDKNQFKKYRKETK